MGFPLIISSVLFTLDLVFIQNLLQDDGPAGWRTVAFISFVVALPCLATNAFVLYRMRTTKIVLPGKARLFWVFQVMGYFASFVGVWANITAVAWWIGLIFIVVSVAAIGMCGSALRTREKQAQRNNTTTPH